MKKTIAILIALIMTLSALAACTEGGRSDERPVTTAERRDPQPSPEIGDDDGNEVTFLRVNYEKNPSCVEGTPLFSWAVNTGKRGMVQKSYRIVVAKSAEDIDAGKSLVWDSGEVASNQNVAVPFGGDKLDEATRYFWRVSVKDGDGAEMKSGAASFSTALTGSGFEGAEWIACATGSGSIDSAKWIWLLAGEAQGNVPAKTLYFRGKVNIAKDVRSAHIAFSADDFGEVYINGKFAAEETEAAGWQNGVIADVTELVRKGSNLIAAKVVNTSMGYGGFIAGLSVVYTDGTSEYFATTNSRAADEAWMATAKDQGGKWFEENASEKDYKKADFGASYGDAPWYRNVTLTAEGSAPLVRGEISIDGEIVNAFLFASAAGLYDAYVNGERIDDSMLNPGRSEYQKRIMYQSFDVTNCLKQGKNVIGAALGRGWYIGAFSPYGGTNPAFICKLVVDYKDGRRVTFGSGSDWTYTLDGPITYNDVFNGETYDARREIDGWCGTDAPKGTWEKVVTVTAKSIGIGELVPQLSGVVKVMAELKPLSVTSIGGKKYIYDFGQNLAGVVRMKVKGAAGTEVTLRHAEMLNDGSAGSDGPKGTLYTANLRTALATDRYILKGDPAGETYTPAFTFHGFRYLEIGGLAEAPSLEDVTALVLYSALEDSGKLETSDELVNKLVSNTYWGQRGNFLSTPTDCPQRDERMGWSGDAQIFSGTAAYNMNVKAFFDKYVTDLNDCQHDDGAYPDVAPETWRANYSGAGNNAWGDAGIIIPWIMYERYGDVSYIEKYYSNMKRYANYLVSTSENYIRSRSAYGDWLSIGESTPVNVTDTAYCIRDFDLLERMARLLGHDKDAERFAATAARYREAWIGKFLRSEGKLKSDTQTSYLVALAFDIFPEEQRQALADRLNTKIVKNNTRLTTGFIGCNLLLPVLCRFGYTDTAFALLQQEAYPSWKYPILQGATTIWERWNSYTLESGFGDAAMNSFNHYSYGSVTEWLYDSLAGIACDTGNPAFAHFFLKPTAGGGITSVSGEYASVRGLIKSSWKATQDGKITSYSCKVPGNTTATLRLFAESADMITEGGVSLADAKGVTLVSVQDGVAEILLGSGEYNFEIKR